MTYPDKPGGAEPVLAWRDGGIAQIRFNRPAVLNAIDVSIARAFHEACQLVERDAAVRAVVISGEGRAFMAGGDLAAMNADPAGVARQLIDGMHGALAILARLPAPVVASVHGAVAGAGLGVALACDLCIAAEGTRFNLAYPGVGTSSDCGTSWALPRIVGVRKALEIALLNDMMDAAEALRLGLVNQVVAANELDGATQKIAERLARGPTHALGQLKTLMRSSLDREFGGQLDAEAEAFLACAGTADFREGVQAFLQKRKPAFHGQ